MPLAETSTSFAPHHPIPHPTLSRKEIRAKEEGPFRNTNRFLTHKDLGSMGEPSVVDHFTYFTSHYKESGTLAHLCLI